jgi:hypothetical protein
MRFLFISPAGAGITLLRSLAFDLFHVADLVALMALGALGTERSLDFVVLSMFCCLREEEWGTMEIDMILLR